MKDLRQRKKIMWKAPDNKQYLTVLSLTLTGLEEIPSSRRKSEVVSSNFSVLATPLPVTAKNEPCPDCN